MSSSRTHSREGDWACAPNQDNPHYGPNRAERLSCILGIWVAWGIMVFTMMAKKRVGRGRVWRFLWRFQVSITETDKKRGLSKQPPTLQKKVPWDDSSILITALRGHELRRGMRWRDGATATPSVWKHRFVQWWTLKKNNPSKTVFESIVRPAPPALHFLEMINQEEEYRPLHRKKLCSFLTLLANRQS